MAVVEIDIPNNGCYTSIIVPDLETTTFFVRFIQDYDNLKEYYNYYGSIEGTRVSPYNVGFENSFVSVTKESSFEGTTLPPLPPETLNQFYNICNIEYPLEFYELSIEDKKIYLQNAGVDLKCWNEDYFYFTPNNLLNTLGSMTHYLFNLFYHNYFIKVGDSYLSLKEPSLGLIPKLPLPLDGKQNLLIPEFFSRRQTQFRENPNRYELYPIEFFFDIHQLFDISIEKEFYLYTDDFFNGNIEDFLNRNTKKVFPDQFEYRYQPDGTLKKINIGNLEYDDITRFFSSNYYTHNYMDIKFHYGFFDGFMVFAEFIEEIKEKRPHPDDGIIYEYVIGGRYMFSRVLTSRYYVEDFSGDIGSWNDFINSINKTNPEEKPLRCCLAECFGITE